MRSLVATAIVFMGVVSSAENFAPVKSNEDFMRLIRASVKIKSPDRILTFVALISMLNNGEIRIEACDALGLTQAIAFVSPGNTKLFDMNSKCRHDLRFWRMSLAKTTGINLSYEQIVDWLFPAIWPKVNTTIKIARKGHLNLEIEQHPPRDGWHGMVQIRLPAYKIDAMIHRLETETAVVSNLFASESPGSDWVRCDGFPMLVR